MIRRRQLIALLGGVAAAWPLAARAQQPAVPVVGLLGTEPPVDVNADRLHAFRQTLSEAGYVDGRNVAIEYHWAGGTGDRLPALVADLVRRQVTVIVAMNTQAALAAKAGTQTLPIVFGTGADPVGLGLVSSLNHPGTNMTGLAVLNTAIVAKRLQLLHELAPAAASIAFLSNPNNPALGEAEMAALQPAASALGVHLAVLNARDQKEIEAAFTSDVEQRAAGLLVSADPLFIRESGFVVAQSARHAVPAIFPYRESVLAGGLASYGTNLSDQYRQLAAYTSRILQGIKPADLPVQQVTKIELVINLKTAKAIGLTVPPTLLARADEVIE
jgi:putative ABC transport system substrate-binding protein